ncbi:hypothetical protein F5B22DRAFT_293535 [Xylaria bambusicola]|uniref:uncharacterized protein n=1 Tax=Xylaria bambusicola TaxID=326684 RepID=UPI0020076DB2|nr:uncharacterized protein F5B22DRAFT_293535 [Xylaria bambusicola]KAI0512789.1 hypothetical protein F5B22DRAFT_293535 [Xylaria bambusicola]
MQFTTLLALALPLVAALPQATSTTSAPAPTQTADLEAICESQAGSYASSCPQCLHNCASTAYPEQCFLSVFTVINGYQANCEARGGYNCRDMAINTYC